MFVLGIDKARVHVHAVCVCNYIYTFIHVYVDYLLFEFPYVMELKCAHSREGLGMRRDIRLDRNSVCRSFFTIDYN